MSIINENCTNFSLLNIDVKLVWLLNNENIDILCASMYMEEICVIQIQRPSRAGALGSIFIIIFLNASSAQWTSQQL
jgi:uncharacterized membrane protein YpjA